MIHWAPIATAPRHGLVEVWADCEGLGGFITRAEWHPDAGWCVDELREVTHWRPIERQPRFILEGDKVGFIFGLRACHSLDQMGPEKSLCGFVYSNEWKVSAKRNKASITATVSRELCTDAI
jgi:hypothetical protein